jgi:hypothetical protein
MSNATRTDAPPGRLPSRGTILLLSLALLAAGAYFSWGWLVALGVAPVLVALAPCAAMCALGLCVRNTDESSCSSNAKKDKSD